MSAYAGRGSLLACLALTLPLAAPGQPPGAPGEKGLTPRVPARNDLYGDPLPAGARARMGTVRFRASLRGFALAPDGKSIALSTPKAVCLRTVPDGRALHTFKAAADSVNAPAARFSPDGKTVATGARKGILRLWDTSTGKNRASLEGHIGGVNGLAFTPDGRTLASASGDGTVRLWHMATGQELLTIRAVDKNLNAVAFDREGRSMAVAAENGSVLLYRTDSREGTPVQGR